MFVKQKTAFDHNSNYYYISGFQEFSFNLSSRIGSIIRTISSLKQAALPEEWVVQLSIHNHGLKHWSFSHNKFHHPMYEGQQLSEKKEASNCQVPLLVPGRTIYSQQIYIYINSLHSFSHHTESNM